MLREIPGGKHISAHSDVFDIRSTDQIFAELPPVRWLIPGLQLGPGRPNGLVGYGSSLKTMCAQEIALAVASGKWALDHFETRQASVLHLDHEQGERATRRRYQRLALGHGIERAHLGDRLRLAALPRVFLDLPNAVDAYARLCEGAELVIIDALRGATPSMDENDSRIRGCIDNLTRVSELLGTTFLVLHHAGKPKDGHSDSRTVMRGSSAIFDAFGCVLQITPGKGKDAPRRVEQTKPPAETTGPLDDFHLVVEDVEHAGDPKAGVRVRWEPIVPVSPVVAANAQCEKDEATLLEVIRANPGSSQTAVIVKAGIPRNRARDVLVTLEEQRRVHVDKGQHGAAKTYRAAP